MKTFKNALAFALMVALFAFLGVRAFAQNVPVPVDPCQLYPKTTVPIVLATTSPSASSQLIAAPSSGSIYICTVQINPASSSTVQLTYGTGTVCGTGSGNLTGAVGSAVSQTDGSTPVMIVPAGNALCETVTATGGQGYLTYVTH